MLDQPTTTLRYWFDRAERAERERDAARVDGMRDILALFTVDRHGKTQDECVQLAEARIAEVERNGTAAEQIGGPR